VKQVDKHKVKEGISWTQAPAFDLCSSFADNNSDSIRKFEGRVCIWACQKEFEKGM